MNCRKMPGKVDTAMGDRSTPKYTILKRTQSNPTISQQMKKISKEIVPEISCENKFIVSDVISKNLNKLEVRIDNNLEENECNVKVKPVTKDLINIKACHGSASCMENLNISSNPARPQRGCHLGDCRSLPQNDKENRNPVRVLQKPTGSLSIVKMTAASPTSNKVFTVKHVRTNDVVNPSCILNSNLLVDQGKPVAVIENQNEHLTEPNKVRESVQTSKSITILKRPDRVTSDPMSKKSVEPINKSELSPPNNESNMKTLDEDEIKTSLVNVGHTTKDTETIAEKIPSHIVNKTRGEEILDHKMKHESEVLLTNIKILKRPDSSTHHLAENKSGQSMKTLEQRLKEYNEARLRIFGEFSAENSLQDEEPEGTNDSEAVSNVLTAEVKFKEQAGEELKQELIAKNNVSELNPEFPEFCPKESSNFAVNSDSNTSSDQVDLPRIEPFNNNSNTKIYSDGSQHPLQYYHQPVPNAKPFYHGSAQSDYSQFDFSSNFSPFPNGFLPNFDYIPFSSRPNFFSNSDTFIPNFPLNYMDLFCPSFNIYEQTIPANFMGCTNYVNYDNFVYDYGFTDFTTDNTADASSYSWPGNGYPVYTQSAMSAIQRLCFCNASTVF